jgi:hypothetical protein
MPHLKEGANRLPVPRSRGTGINPKTLPDECGDLIKVHFDS